MSTWTDRANAVLPGGVNSPVRAWNGVGGDPVPLASARGAYVTDADGRDYVDLVGSWGPALLGHAHPAVVEAVREAAGRGLSFGATSEGEVALAEAIRDRYAPAQKVRLVSTGTEATMTAIRLARGATERDLIVKFAGCYHGHCDALLVAAGSGLATAGVPDSAGVPAGAARDTVVVPYGDADALTAVFAEHGHRIAAVITEAAPCNMGVVRPPAGFNALAATLCTTNGSVFIVDEVLTGFRAGPAGWWGEERGRSPEVGADTWEPDLVTFGKVIGGGLPVAALAGRADLMDQLAPQGAVYQAGTLSGNPVAVAAGLATLNALTAEVYTHVTAVSHQIADGIHAALERAGVAHAIGRAGTLFSVFLGLDSAPTTFDQVAAQDTAGYASLFHSLHDAGVYLPPSAFEAWFVSGSHGDAEAEQVITAVAHWAASQ
ncbi:MAG: glutamate-1-semialdehyde 2,1-aminomutase [Demequina sp.]